MVKLCAQAAEKLQEKNISVEVIDLRTIRPLDIETVAQSLTKTHFCVVVEEGYSFAGIASEIGFELQSMCFDELDAPIGRVTQKDIPLPYSKVLEQESLPTVERIIAEVEKTLCL